MKITLFLEKNIDQNASIYFDKAKKARKKKEGAKAIIQKAESQLIQIKEEKIVKKEKRQKEWYEKFHWFISSEDFLCIGGRDATTNDILIKKHMDKDDIVFHTNIAGSPFFIIKTEGKTVGEATIKETAQATASYSRAWKLGVPTTEVFYVKPEQVSLTPKSGEYLEKGSFMIYGKTTRLQPALEIAIGITSDKHLIGGPVGAIKKNAEKQVIIKQGKDKPSEIAKKIKKLFGYDDVDEIIRFLPTSGQIQK